jgi:hypothetical protein
MTGSHIVILFVSYIVVSSASNAMSLEDRTLYGFVFRFLRLLTNSAAPFVAQEVHLPLPQKNSPTAETTTSKN